MNMASALTEPVLQDTEEVNKEGSCLNNIRFNDNLRPESETTFMNSLPN